jgi:hypothetical protein
MRRSHLLSVFALSALILVPGLRAAVYNIESGPQTRRAVASPRDTQTNDDWCRDTNSGYGDRRRETACEVRDLTVSNGSRLDVAESNGSISVTGGSRRDAHVRARVTAQADTEQEAREILREVRISTDGGRIRSTGPERGFRGNRQWSVSYRIEGPENMDLTAESSNGSVAVTGITGVIRAETSNGSLRMVDIGGDVDVSTSNGSVTIALSGTTWQGRGLEASTSNGSLRIDIPANYNARLIAGTSNGSMDVDFPITIQGRINRGRSRDIDTTLGRGGPTLRVTTSNGSLRVGRK